MAKSTPVKKAWRSLSLARRHHRRASRSIDGRRHLEQRDVDCRSSRSTSRAERRSSSRRSSRAARPFSRAAQPGRLDHPPAHRRVRCLRVGDHHPGSPEHRRLDPGNARRGDAATASRRPRSSTSARSWSRAARRTTVVGATASRRPRRLPTPATAVDAVDQPTNASDLNWVTPALQPSSTRSTAAVAMRRAAPTSPRPTSR